MASDSSAPALPDPNRYITTNDGNARSAFSTTLPPPLPVVNNLGGALFRLGYLAPRAPASLTSQTDLKAYESGLQEVPPLVPSGGVAAVWYIDTPPNSSSPMHRTVSLDIIVQLEGEIQLTIESGETRILKPGDMAVQRSTMHAWRNPSSTKWTRMLGVMAECQPVEVGEKTLGTVLEGS